MNKAIAKLHFITNYQSSLSQVEQCKIACNAGLPWIQLRVKNVDLANALFIAKEAKAICDAHQVILIINDFVEIAAQIKSHGVHLGKNDMAPAEARKILGHHAIIGATANSEHDLVKLQSENIDYIGFGPYRFTNTKQNLAPVLGLKLMQQIIEKQFINKFPIIAIGGIKHGDVAEILSAGLHGVAISSAITESGNMQLEAQKFLKACH